MANDVRPFGKRALAAACGTVYSRFQNVPFPSHTQLYLSLALIILTCIQELVWFRVNSLNKFYFR